MQMERQQPGAQGEAHKQYPNSIMPMKHKHRMIAAT